MTLKGHHLSALVSSSAGWEDDAPFAAIVGMQ